MACLANDTNSEAPAQVVATLAVLHLAGRLYLRFRLAVRNLRVYTRFMSEDLPCVCTTLRRATRAITATYDKALEPSGLRITQFSVLRTLARHGPMPVTRLAAKVALERSTMGRNLDLLERRGLVTLDVGDTDQRERIVNLTPAGEVAIQDALPRWREIQDLMGSLIDHAAVSAIANQVSRLHDE